MGISFTQNTQALLKIVLVFLGLLTLGSGILLTPGVPEEAWGLVALLGGLAGLLRFLQARVNFGQRSSAGIALVIPALFVYGPGVAFWVSIWGLLLADLILAPQRFTRDRKSRQTLIISLISLPISAVAGSILYQSLGGVYGDFSFALLAPALGGILLYLLLVMILLNAVSRLVWEPDPSNAAALGGLTPNDTVNLFFGGILGLINSLIISQNLYGGLVLATVVTLFTNQYARIAAHSKELYLGIINALMVLIEFRDPYTKGHSDRVATYAVHIARALGLAERETDQIYHAALLHDLGKTGVSQKILHKPGPLTKREYARIKEHVEISAQIIGQIDHEGQIYRLVRSHHERYDGHGYPDGLKGNEIPLGARIIAIADSFDAMTSLRPYRKSFTIPQALEEIAAGSGTQLDPVITGKAIPILRRLSATFQWGSEAEEFPLRGISSPLRRSFWEGESSLLNRIDRSEVLDKLGVCGVVHYHNGDFTTPLPKQCFDCKLAFEALGTLAKQATESQVKREDFLVTEDQQIFHCSALPHGDEADLVIIQCSGMLAVEEEAQSKVEHAYSEALALLTEGKFRLLAEEELPEYVGGQYLWQVPLESPQELPELFPMLTRLFTELNLNDDQLERLLTCVDEAAHNVLKHGQKGQVSIVALQDKLRVIVADNGPGLDIRRLPEILFRSQGPGRIKQGLALMLKCLDNVFLCTGVNGTTLILEERVSQ